MPTVTIEGFKFRFYSSDGNEPPHMHVIRGEAEAKIWLQPVVVEYNRRHSTSELNRILRLTRQHQTHLLGSGMRTSAYSVTAQVAATGVRFDKNLLHVSLSDGREISIPIDQVEWLRWLVNATDEQRARWSLEPGGFAIYWEDLDDGIEVSRLLDLQPFS